jgi:hypothetical protein
LRPRVGLTFAGSSREGSVIELDRLIYLDLQKTASGQIIDTLFGICPEAFRHRDRHAPLRGSGDKPVYISIRNPWDWHVSLWAFGCIGHGVFRASLVDAFPAAAALYADVQDGRHFRAWLGLVAETARWGARLLAENYPAAALAQDCGLMTGRLLKIAGYEGRSGDRRAIAEDAAALLDPMNAIRLERLGADLGALLDRHFANRRPADWREILARRTANKHNASAHGASRDLYDRATRALVAKREWLMIERFGYRFPD